MGPALDSGALILPVGVPVCVLEALVAGFPAGGQSVQGAPKPGNALLIRPASKELGVVEILVLL